MRKAPENTGIVQYFRGVPIGGEKEIRTLVGVLAQTRFPVVRLRPAQPSLRADPDIIAQRKIKIKPFFKKISKIPFL